MCEWTLKSCHPSITISIHPVQGCRGVDSIPACIGWEPGYNLHRWAVYDRVKRWRLTNVFTYTNMYVFGLWAETQNIHLLRQQCSAHGVKTAHSKHCLFKGPYQKPCSVLFWLTSWSGLSWEHPWTVTHEYWPNTSSIWGVVLHGDVNILHIVHPLKDL